MYIVPGFIPKGQHYFGNRYAIICKGAISDFEGDHQLYKSNANELKLTEAVQSGKIDKSQVPNLPVSKSGPQLLFRRMTFLYPATLKSVGYYFIPALKKNAFECSSVRVSVRLSIHPSVLRFHFLSGIFLTDFLQI